MEEGPVSSNEVMCLASGLILYGISTICNTDFEISLGSYCDVDLTLENILGLLVVVRAVSCRPGHNTVEPSGQVRGRV